MIKAFSGALSLALTILVLHWLLPEVMDLVIQLLIKLLKIINASLDQLSQAPAL